MSHQSNNVRVAQSRHGLDDVSTAMIKIGVNVVKRNPIKVGAYVVGLLICVAFSGFAITDTQRANYYQHLDSINHVPLYEVEEKLVSASIGYRATKGWFWSCDATCQEYKAQMDSYQREYNVLKYDEELKMSSAKASLGLFSEHGVDETRGLFWERFTQGKGFATRQSKWDALFMGISAMGRDESIFEYAFRVIINMLFNFTIGVFGAVVAFIWGLGGIVRTYQANFLAGATFFLFGSLAAISFALTWIIGLYVATAGTVYVGAKLIASNMRIQDNPNNAQYRRRMQ